MEAALAGIPEEWKSLMDLDYLTRVIAPTVETEDIAPPANLVFEALRYGKPADITVVIMGPDPFPTPGDAQGICFSVPAGTALPESLKRIFGCLDRAGLRREHAAEGKKTVLVSGDLRPWAVLMFNSALTTRVGARRAHAAAWKPFVDDFLRRFCAERAEAGACVHFLRRFCAERAEAGACVHFLLWGGDARAYAGLARRHKHAVHEWSYPSPFADNKLPEEGRFRACPHFEDVNAALAAGGRRPIVWDNLSPVVARQKAGLSSQAELVPNRIVVRNASDTLDWKRGDIFPPTSGSCCALSATSSCDVAHRRFGSFAGCSHRLVLLDAAVCIVAPHCFPQLSAALRQKTAFSRMASILGWSYPLKVGGSVISGYAVQVVNVRPVIRVRVKRQGDQTVHPDAARRDHISGHVRPLRQSSPVYEETSF